MVVGFLRDIFLRVIEHSVKADETFANSSTVNKIKYGSKKYEVEYIITCTLLVSSLYNAILLN